MITLEEKVKELYNELKPKCEKEGLNIDWEIHKALVKFRKEHPDLDEQWGREAVTDRRSQAHAL
jgi:hypothetical protein